MCLNGSLKLIDSSTSNGNNCRYKDNFPVCSHFNKNELVSYDMTFLTFINVVTFINVLRLKTSNIRCTQSTRSNVIKEHF